MSGLANIFEGAGPQCV